MIDKTYTAPEVAQLVEQERLRAVAQFRDALQNSHKAMCDAHSTVKFYLEREMNAPANHQEFAREAAEKLRAYEAAIFAMQKILDAPDAQRWLEEHDRELLKQKEIDVAKHISKAALDGCQCEPCLAAKKLTEEHDRELRRKVWQECNRQIDADKQEVATILLNTIYYKHGPASAQDWVYGVGNAIELWKKARLESGMPVYGDPAVREECAQRLDALVARWQMTPMMKGNGAYCHGWKHGQETSADELAELAAAIRSHTPPKEGQ